MNIKFYDEKHEKITADCLLKMGEKANYSSYRSVAYLLGLDSVCREHINEIFDFEEMKFKRDCFNKLWQTSSSIRTARLMYQLFTKFIPEENAEHFAVVNIFDYGTYNEYYFEAIRIVCS